MKTKTMQFASLGMEIPPLEADKEGKLRGGFGVFNSGMEASALGVNTNCDCNCDCDTNDNCNCNCKCGTNTNCNCGCPKATPTATSTSKVTPVSEGSVSLNFSSSFLF